MYILIKCSCMFIVDMQLNVPVPPMFILPSSTIICHMNATYLGKTNINISRPK